MQAEIICVGTELLLGDILNTNARYLARQLAGLGISVYHQSVVGDNHDRLAALVEEAKGRSDVLLFTGGLGPTDDDLTKTTVAEVFGDTLVQDEEEVARLQKFFCAFGRHMTENNLKQAMVPQKGGKIANPNGTAPGVWFSDGGCTAYLMPGPPSEMRPMFESFVRPRLAAGQDAVLCSRTLRVFGVGESDMEERLRPVLAGTNPTAALYAKTGEVHLRITAKAANEAQGLAACAATAERVYEILGDRVYGEGEEGLEHVVVRLLADNKEMVATAESCTGGLLSARVTAVPGASAVFGFGVCSYANEAKMRLLGVSADTLADHGAVSEQTAGEMARGVCALSGARYGVAVTGIAGPDGGTAEKPVGLVYIAAHDGERTWVKRINVPGRSRIYVRSLASSHALDMVRRMVAGLPQKGVLE